MATVEGVQLKVEIDGDKQTIRALGKIVDAEQTVESQAEKMKQQVVESTQSSSKSIDEMAESAESASSSFKEASDSGEQMGDNVRQGMADASTSSERAEQSVRGYAQAAEQAEASTTRMRRSVKASANNLGFELVQASQDAKFGLAGFANQIPLMTDQFSQLQSKTGSTSGAFAALFSALKGPAGIIGAFTLLLTFKDEIVGFFTDTEESAESLDKQLRDTSDVLKTIGGDLEGTKSDVEALIGSLQDIQGVFGGGFGEAIDTILSSGSGRRGQIRAIEALQANLRGSGEDAQRLRQVLRGAGIDVETILTANVRESASALRQVRTEIEQNADALRGIEADPTAALADTEQATADAIQERFGQVSTALSAEVELGFKTGRERAEEQLKFLRQAMQAIIRDEDLSRQADAFDPLLRKIRQLRIEIAKLKFAESYTVRDVTPIRTDEVPAAGPEQVSNAVEDGKIDRLTGSPGAGSIPDEEQQQREDETAGTFQRAFASGLQQGINQELQPLLDQIENDFARAIISAMVQATTSKVATEFTDMLFDSVRGAQQKRSTARQAAGAAAGMGGRYASSGAAKSSSPNVDTNFAGKAKPQGGLNKASLGLTSAGTGAGLGQGVQKATGSKVAGGLAGAGMAAILAATGGAGAPLILGAALAGGLGGFFEEGGRPPVGRPSVVGESGPELFVPDQPGTIVPNDGLTRPATRSMEGADVANEVRRLREEMSLEVNITADRRTKRQFLEDGAEEIQRKRQSQR